MWCVMYCFGGEVNCGVDIEYDVVGEICLLVIGLFFLFGSIDVDE